MNDEIKCAIDVCKKAQRNYDLTKPVSEEDLETLIYVAANSPSKQNETHYSLRVYTDPKIIREIYKLTQLFTFQTNTQTDKIFGETAEKFVTDHRYAVTNSQILAPVVFVYCDETKNIRSGTHIVATQPNATRIAIDTLNEQKNLSIGISSGQLVMAAALLGYKTGYCSAFERDINGENSDSVQKLLKLKSEPKLLVGVGYPHPDMTRLEHPEVLNKDISIKEGKHGDEDKRWTFPSMLNEDLYKTYHYGFEKIDVYIDDKRYKK